MEHTEKNNEETEEGHESGRTGEVVMATKMHMRNDGDKRDMQGMK